MSCKKGDHKLKNAASTGDFDNVVIAIELYDADPCCSNNAPLLFSVNALTSKNIGQEASKYSLINYLLSHGADITSHDFIIIKSAITRFDTKLLSLAIEHRPEILTECGQVLHSSLFLLSPEDGNINNLISLLLDTGLSPNYLLETDMNICPSIVGFLVSKGADILHHKGKHAHAYFSHLKKPHLQLLSEFDKPYHPHIMRLMREQL